MHKQRIITALILLPVVIVLVLFLPTIAFAIFMAAVMALAAWEWANLVGYQSIVVKCFYVVTVLLGILVADALPVAWVLSIGCAAWVWALFAIIAYQKDRFLLGFASSHVRVVLGIIMLVASWVGFVVIREDINIGPGYLLYLLFIVWAADSGAYYAGRLWGKHHLAKVSPKKTWEGVLGGVVTALAIAMIGSIWIPVYSHLLLWLLVVVTISISVIGDLGISLLKRVSGVKDSGKLLPGHGGVLDRIDSLLAATVVFALGSILLGF